MIYDTSKTIILAIHYMFYEIKIKLSLPLLPPQPTKQLLYSSSTFNDNCSTLPPPCCWLVYSPPMSNCCYTSIEVSTFYLLLGNRKHACHYIYTCMLYVWSKWLEILFFCSQPNLDINAGPPQIQNANACQDELNRLIDMLCLNC